MMKSVVDRKITKRNLNEVSFLQRHLTRSAILKIFVADWIEGHVNCEKFRKVARLSASLRSLPVLSLPLLFSIVLYCQDRYQLK
jgi:hypothetical protein